MISLKEHLIKQHIKLNQNKYDFVDLDLPGGTLWAACNVGAKTPEECGGLYQWGGLEDMTDKDCRWVSCPFNDNKETYCEQAWLAYMNNVLDGNGNLKPKYDVAYKESNGIYRMPTKAEFDVLSNYTDKEPYTINNVTGLKFISKKDKSKWIFMPFCGYASGEDINYEKIHGYYWSSTSSGTDYTKAHRLRLGTNTTFCDINDLIRYRGLSVRPVKAKK